MENYATSMTCPMSPSAVAFPLAVTDLTGTSMAYGHCVGTRIAAPLTARVQGTGVSTSRIRTAVKATAQLPINDVFVTGDVSGIRSTWSPPV